MVVCQAQIACYCLVIHELFSAAYRNNHNQLRGLFGPARGKSTAVSEIGIHSDLWRISTLSHKSRWVPRWLNRWPNFIPKRWRLPLQRLSSGYLFTIPKRSPAELPGRYVKEQEVVLILLIYFFCSTCARLAAKPPVVWQDHYTEPVINETNETWNTWKKMKIAGIFMKIGSRSISNQNNLSFDTHWGYHATYSLHLHPWSLTARPWKKRSWKTNYFPIGFW